MSTSTPGLVTHLTLESVAAVHAGLSGLGLDWLSQEEQARLSAMSAPHRRTQFIAGRQLARQCLAARGGDRWQAYVLSAPDDGAPQLLARPPASEPLYFSLSHSGDWLACAVSSQPVGVDVECSDRVRDFPALSEWMHEPQALQDMPASPGEQQAWFYAQWTLKEAWLKQVTSASSSRPSMRSARFTACGNSPGTAMVGQGTAFTVAVCPATPATLQWEGGVLGQVQWVNWKCAD
jgi:4'-phosphopantetheinyl transferase